MEPKHIIFILGALFCVPLGIAVASQSRKALDFVFALLVFGTAQPSALFGMPTDINFLSREWYRGTTRGIEISYLDLLALILLFASLMTRNRERRPFRWPPSLGFLLLYLLWCILSVAVIGTPKLFGLFELTKVVRGVLLFLAVTAYVRSPREIRVFVWALVVTISYQLYVCLYDRYILSRHRIFGTLGHPNNLSMYALQLVPIFIAIPLAVDCGRRLKWACFVAYAAAVSCVLLSISRTGFAALILISGVTYLLGAGLRPSFTRLSFAIAGLVVVSLLSGKAWNTISSRYAESTIEEYASEDLGGRGGYWRDAFQMAGEHPFGVGLNNWSYWQTNEYGPRNGIYYLPYEGTSIAPDQRVLPRRNLSTTAQAPPSHTLVGLTLGELGFPGVLFLLMLWVRWLTLSAAVYPRNKGMTAYIGLGIACSLLAVFLHCITEWTYRHTSIYFMTHVMVGIAAVLYSYSPSTRNLRELAFDGLRGRTAPVRRRYGRRPEQAPAIRGEDVTT